MEESFDEEEEEKEEEDEEEDEEEEEEEEDEKDFDLVRPFFVWVGVERSMRICGGFDGGCEEYLLAVEVLQAKAGIIC